MTKMLWCVLHSCPQAEVLERTASKASQVSELLRKITALHWFPARRRANSLDAVTDTLCKTNHCKQRLYIDSMQTYRYVQY